MSPLRGIAFKLCAVIFFIVMSALVKATSSHVPGGQAVFFRSFFAIPVILVWLTATKDLKTGFYTKNPIGHLWRGCAGTLSMGLGFASLAYLPFPDVTAIGYTAPLLTVIFAAIFLGENVRFFRISMVILGLIGVFIVVSPRLSLLNGEGADDRQIFGVALVIASAVFAAFAQILVRSLVHQEKTATIVFYFSLSSAVLSLLTLPFGWVWPTPTETMLLICAGILGGIGQILLTTSYRYADASLVAPFDYASMLFALAIGWFAFGEMPTPTMLAGAALIMVAGIMIIWRERQLGLKRARQRKSMSP